MHLVIFGVLSRLVAFLICFLICTYLQGRENLVLKNFVRQGKHKYIVVANSRVERGNQVLRHFVPHALSNFRDIAYWEAKIDARFLLLKRENSNN